MIAPVYMPGINDEEMPELIEFALKIGAGKRWPPLGIQKFEHYRLGRSPGKIKAENWWHFYNRSMTELGEAVLHTAAAQGPGLRD